MQDAYREYVEKDERLWGVVEPVLSGLKTLSSEQVETLVFYLKSLHGYYPASANESLNRSPFEDRMATIRNSDEQKSLLRGAHRRLGLLIGLVAGFLGGTGLLVLATGGAKAGGILVAVGIGLVALGNYVGFFPAIERYKHQDRRYFLECIRAARACNELDWTSLFGYDSSTKPGPQSDEAIRQTHQRIAELTHQLRTALYNDEYMDYSRPRA